MLMFLPCYQLREEFTAETNIHLDLAAKERIC